MNPVGMRAERGFTLLESMVVLAVIGVVMAVGIPNMSSWLSAASAANTAQFYVEGYRVAKGQALANNSRSRVVFSENQTSGQLDWQVDVCFPTSDDACAANSSRWSDVDEDADAPSSGAVQTRSVFRSSSSLPRPASVRVTPESDAEAVYFTELGWIDSTKPALTRLDFAPGGHSDAFPPSAVVVTLAGAIVTCNPDAISGDSRRCP